ncbi:MAG: hypothetical protein U5J95_04425 [Balneolaceae bacterium]|nr:hypothetical protein [Balneolaceae bacterium]
MSDLPFEIPKSLASYVEHFENDPLNATTRLKKQLKKRGPDAVGYFLLSWFYHLKGINDKAIEEALKAKTLAPGSPFFEKLHYYLSHPNNFEAWKPVSTHSGESVSSAAGNNTGPVLENLDMLIQQLSEVEAVKITMPSETTLESEPNWDDTLDDTDDIVSETLASIHENQGKTDAAINTYKRLKKLNKEKKDYYGEQISRLRKVQKKKDKE